MKFDFNRDCDMIELGIYFKRIKNELILNDLEGTLKELSKELKSRAGFLL